MSEEEFAQFLADCPPFDSLEPAALRLVVSAARLENFAAGALVVDAFAEPVVEVFVVLSGHVDLWNAPNAEDEPADERLAAGGVFGYSAMLSQQSVGPRAVAVGRTTLGRIPASAVAPAFESRRGARFLVEHLSASHQRTAGLPNYSTVDELIGRSPLLVDPDLPLRDVAVQMTDRGVSYAALRLPEGGYGMVTDSLLRRRVIVEGLAVATPARVVAGEPVVTAMLGDSAAEALMLMLDHPAGILLVTDRSGSLRGAIAPEDFVVSPTTAGVALGEQLRRATTAQELAERAHRLPGLLRDLLARGLASSKVIAVYSAMIDTIVRRSIDLVFGAQSEIPVDAFTWLSLGSNGRREAVPSSDVDCAVAFDDSVGKEEMARYRARFVDVMAIITASGLGMDGNGATPRRALFARTNAQWRAAGLRWMAAPAESKGAVMASLLVDGRPIHGDPGLPEVTKVFGDLRRHRGTMRLLLQESLSRRARLHSLREVLARRVGTFDVKAHALVPVINIARWAALSVGSSELATVERLRAAAGSTMLPDDQADTLIEVFEVLQRLRLRYQLAQQERGHRASDVMTMDLLSPIDRSVIAQAVREISAIQRRMDNVSQYVPAEAWSAPNPD